MICKNCDNFYIGQTQDFKQKFAKDKSDGKCQKPAQQALQDMFRTALILALVSSAAFHQQNHVSDFF